MARVTLIRGDGIGPEIMDATLEVVGATGARIEWDERPAGQKAIVTHGAPLPPETLDSIRETGIALKGPLATPIGGGYRSINVTLRQELDLYANVRPVKTFEGVSSPFEGIDLVVIRESTEELYSGIEFHIDPRRQVAQAVSIVTRAACDRVLRFAFEYARAHRRRKVTLVHKANILKLTNGLFLDAGRTVASEYPDVELEDRIVDNMAMQLVMRPKAFDVIVTTNLFGDILSDLTAGLIGGLGLAPSAAIGEKATIFEAVHGTAPDIAGKGVANPTALTLSAAMLLRRIGLGEHATRVEDAIRAVLREGKIRTPDLGGRSTTKQFAGAVKERLA